MKMGINTDITRNLWNENLSKKLQILNYLEPILKIKDFRPRSDELKDLIKHYDPLAITLLIIQLIIDSFKLEVNIKMELTHKELINKIIPFLQSIDDKKGLIVTREQHIKFIEEIIARLAAKQANFHQVRFIDYSDPNLKIRERNFAILYTKTQVDGTISYTIQPQMISILASIGSEFDPEDEVMANKLLLKDQIERKNVKNALNLIRKQINDTKTYYADIEMVITEIKRDYKSNRWRQHHRAKLESSEQLLSEWLEWQNEINLAIEKYFFGIDESNFEQFIKLVHLKEGVENSHSMFVKLHFIVNRAIETFFHEHFKQAMYIPEIKTFYNLEEEILPFVCKIALKDEPKVVRALIRYFSHLHITPIHSLSNTLNYLLSGIHHKKQEKILIEEQKIEPLELYRKFPGDVQKQAYAVFNEFLQLNPRTSLTKFLIWANEKKIKYEIVIFLCLLLQTNFSELNTKFLPKVRMKIMEPFDIQFEERRIWGENIQMEVID